MRRREFVTGIAVLTAWPLAAHGQQPRRVGVLIALEEEDPQTKSYLAAFREALRALGWIEGQSLQIEHRAAPDLDGLRSGAAELLRQAPDLMVTNTTPATNVVRQASANMRIVFISVSDPIGPGIVKSLDRPGGNITGFTNFEETMGGKWLELLREIAPSVKRASMLFNPETANAGSSGGIYRPGFQKISSREVNHVDFGFCRRSPPPPASTPGIPVGRPGRSSRSSPSKRSQDRPHGMPRNRARSPWIYFGDEKLRGCRRRLRSFCNRCICYIPPVLCPPRANSTQR